MKLSNRQIADAIVDQLMAGKAHAGIAASAAAYLVSERRSKDIDGVMRQVERLLESQHGQREVTVTSAHSLSGVQKKEIEAIFSGKAKNVILNEIIDPHVIGGVKVESNAERLDLTIRRRLQRLKEMGA